VGKDPNCPICGENKTIHELIDYDEFCGIGRGVDAPPEEAPEVQISVEEFNDNLKNDNNVVLLDVREPVEIDICKIENATLIPLGQIPQRANELDTADEIVVYCHHGMRSLQATMFLRNLGFMKVRNLTGGIDKWAEQIDPSMPRY